MIIYPNYPGAYCFWNKISNKIYVGSALNLNNRINNHLKAKNSNQHLQNAIRHYGINSFCITYQVLETKEEALCLEQMLLDYIFKLNIPKYNLSANASGGAGLNSLLIYALNVEKPKNTYIFKSRLEAKTFTKVSRINIWRSCKDAQPENGDGRWLFSDISEKDLIYKFNNLKQKEIKGSNINRAFILINKKTLEKSQIFYSAYEPLQQGYKINVGNLGSCLLGNRKSVGGYNVKSL
jgi:group I intron endonuclease